MQNSQNQIIELSETRKTILSIINYLNSNIVDPITKGDILTIKETDLETNLEILIGKRDNISSTLIKLSNVLIKIIPLEFKLNKEFEIENSQLEESRELKPEDIEIINRYLNRVKNLRSKTEKIDIKKEPNLFDFSLKDSDS